MGNIKEMRINKLMEGWQVTRLVIIAGVVVLLDQVTKLIILEKLVYGRIIRVIPGFFNITHVQNPGGAFGFLANQSDGVRSLVFLFISSLAVCFILYLYRSIPRTHPLLSGAFAMIMGGAVGNLIDRVRFGRVIDFLDCYVGNLHWPAFNVADSAICIGVGIFAWHVIFNKMPETDGFF